MRSRSHARLVAFHLALGLVLLACGQKPGVYVEGTPLAQAPLPAVPTTDDPGDALTDTLPTEDDVALPEAGDPTTPVTSNEPARQQQQAQQPQAQQAQQAEQPPATAGQRQLRGSNRTGVTDEKITIAAHAPVTGAAPLPAIVFEQSADLYWRWLQEEKGQKVLGREVEVVFQDDRYEPSTARQVCRQLMQQGFSLSGAGADGIAACGALAGQLQVPYISLGADQGALTGNPWYFAMSITYPQQSELWSQYVVRHHSGQKVGAIAIATQNWNDAVSAWEAGLRKRGVDHLATLRHPRDDSSWYASYARRLGDEGVEVVYALTSPLHLIRFAQVARDQGHNFHFLYISPGGLNAVLENGCPALSNATAFSAWPSIDVIDRYDPDFRRAIRRFNISERDLDLSLALWGVNKSAHQLFLHYERLYGRDLTREDFREATSTAVIKSGVFPEQHLTPQNQFGTRPGTHVLQADCTREVWADGGTFKTSF